MSNTDFNMNNDYWKMEIEKADYDEVRLKITFKKDSIPEQQIRVLEAHIRLILQGCGRLDSNPTKR